MTQTIFAMPNHHVEDSGTPPNVVGTLGSPPIYHGYFENRHGEQWIFTYDPKREEGTLTGGDAGWGEVFVVQNGYAINCMLAESERRWLGACWYEATAFDYRLQNPKQEGGGL